MLDRVEESLNRFISIISARLVDISAVVTILLILLIVADVVSRRFFNAPIRASTELATVGFSIIVFLPLAWAAIKGVHVELDFLVIRFPKKIRFGIEVAIMLFTTIMLGLMSWQIFVRGTKLQAAHQVTVLLAVPLYIFAYLAAFGSLILTLAYFMKLVRAIRDLTA